MKYRWIFTCNDNSGTIFKTTNKLKYEYTSTETSVSSLNDKSGTLLTSNSKKGGSARTKNDEIETINALSKFACSKFSRNLSGSHNKKIKEKYYSKR